MDLSYKGKMHSAEHLKDTGETKPLRVWQPAPKSG